MRGDRSLRPQRPHRIAHRVVATPITTLCTQLLEQNARRIVHLRRPFGEPVRMRGQQRSARRRPRVRRPSLFRQRCAHRLAVQSGRSGDLRHRLPFAPHATYFLPPLPADHRLLRALLGHDYGSRDFLHPLPDVHSPSPFLRGVGRFQFLQLGIIGLLLTLFTATKRICGWRTAAQIAAASLASFFPDSRNGLTNSGAMMRAL